MSLYICECVYIYIYIYINKYITIHMHKLNKHNSICINTCIYMCK